MSQRHSGYEPIAGDAYYTPAWVTEALLSAEDFDGLIWEPATGAGHMADVLRHRGSVVQTDIAWDNSYDFFHCFALHDTAIQAIVTNPPFSQSDEFVRHALQLMEPQEGKVAMLLPLAWDAAKSRRDLFADHPAFATKYILTHRIRWVNLEQKTAGPSQNHAWYVWDWERCSENNRGTVKAPTLGWLPLNEDSKREQAACLASEA